MKKNLISLALLMSTMSMNAAVSVDRIEPTNWYVGMKDTSLQLMVYGKDVLTIINGKREANELDVKRYAEIIGNAEKAIDVTTGRNVIINHNIKLRPRQAMILEF